MFGLAECIAKLFFRSADLLDGGSELSMQIPGLFLASASSPECIAEFFFPSAGSTKCSADFFFRSAGLKKCIAEFFFRSAGLKEWTADSFHPIEGPERRAYFDRRPVPGRRADFFSPKTPKDSISRISLFILGVWD
jgi:hypothetical protein